MDLIDCHTHCYPPEAAADPAGWARARGEGHWAAVVAPQDRPSIQGWVDAGRMLADMDRAGIGRAILLGWYWENRDTCREHNRLMADWLRAHPGRFSAFAAIHAADPPAAVTDQLREAEELGFRGIGECLGPVQGYDFSSPGFRTLAAWASERGWPVNFHVTEAAGHDHPGRVTTPLDSFVALAREFPDLRMILAHWGGGLPFFEQNRRIAPVLRNVHYDTAASPLLYEPGIFRRVVDLVGPRRVLFGSDYPLRLYPREDNQPQILRFVDEVRNKGGLDDRECALVLGGNAARLLGGD